MCKGVKHIDFAVNIFSLFYDFFKRLKSTNLPHIQNWGTGVTGCPRIYSMSTCVNIWRLQHILVILRSSKTCPSGVLS